jgi:WD40 repeat protein
MKRLVAASHSTRRAPSSRWSSWDSSATVMSVATDKRALELLGHTRFVNDVTYSPVGDLMATTSFDTTMRIWNASTGQLLQIDLTIRSPPCRCSVPTVGT